MPIERIGHFIIERVTTSRAHAGIEIIVLDADNTYSTHVLNEGEWDDVKRAGDAAFADWYAAKGEQPPRPLTPFK